MTADNAANILKAFQLKWDTEAVSQPKTPVEVIKGADAEQDDDPEVPLEVPEEEEDLRDILDYICEESEEVDIEKLLTAAVVERNTCHSHLAQLAINNAI